MAPLGRSSHSRRTVIASCLLMILAWHAEAIGGQLNLTWLDSANNELGFSVERSTGTTGTPTEIATTGPGLTAYTDPTVADGTTYCYRVRAFNTTAYSDYSNLACGATAQAFGLAVVKMGAGSGAVISSPSGIICGSSCSATYASGTAVTLTASPATGSTFTGWSGGGCSGTGACTVTMTATTTVTATCDLQPSQSVTLSVGKSGAGTGTVTSAPAGINCGTTCSASYATGTAVALTAAPATGSTFTGWSGGGCSGTGTCTVTLTATTTATATFALQPVTLSVGTSGSGTGTVTSTPAGINCGTTCSASYPFGTAVTLTAAPTTGSTFGGWSGACLGTGTCTVTLTSATAAAATFNPSPAQSPTLTVSLAGGKGTVTSAPAGISCGTTCSASYPSGTVVVLTAIGGSNFVFKGWGGACSGTGTCTVTMTTATAVSAAFANVNKK